MHFPPTFARLVPGRRRKAVPTHSNVPVADRPPASDIASPGPPTPRSQMHAENVSRTRPLNDSAHAASPQTIDSKLISPSGTYLGLPFPTTPSSTAVSHLHTPAQHGTGKGKRVEPFSIEVNITQEIDVTHESSGLGLENVDVDVFGHPLVRHQPSVEVVRGTVPTLSPISPLPPLPGPSPLCTVINVESPQSPSLETDDDDPPRTLSSLEKPASRDALSPLHSSNSQRSPSCGSESQRQAADSAAKCVADTLSPPAPPIGSSSLEPLVHQDLGAMLDILCRLSSLARSSVPLGKKLTALKALLNEAAALDTFKLLEEPSEPEASGSKIEEHPDGSHVVDADLDPSPYPTNNLEHNAPPGLPPPPHPEEQVARPGKRKRQMSQGQARKELDMAADNLIAQVQKSGDDRAEQTDKSISLPASKARDVQAPRRKDLEPHLCLGPGRIIRHDEGSFTIIRKLGAGGYGGVYLVHDEDGQHFAVKVMPRSLGKYVREEHEVLKNAAERDEPFLAHLLMSFQDDFFIYFVMHAYVSDLASTSELIVTRGSTRVVWEFYRSAAELISGLASLHKMGYVHLDLKPENVLISPTGHIAITDFGRASPVNAGGRLGDVSCFGTLGYEAPETFLPGLFGDGTEEVTQKADIFSLGITLVRLVTHMESAVYWGVAPLKLAAWGAADDAPDSRPCNARAADAMHLVMAAQDPLELSPLLEIKAENPMLFDLLSKMLARDPRDRWSAEQLKSHCYFQYINWDELETCPPIYQVTTKDDPTLMEAESAAPPPVVPKNNYNFSYRHLTKT